VSKRQTLILEAATRVIARSGVRGLRVEELAAEAGISTALIYYHFGDRAGLLRRTLEFISDRADRYTSEAGFDPLRPRKELEQMLLLELQDDPTVRENSTAWTELRASAIFDPDLREQLRSATSKWTDDAAALIRLAQEAGQARTGIDVGAAAERLTSLVEGVSDRWLSDSLTLERARELVSGAVEAELGS
jgi:AcrR family transcriptional regulator